MIARFTRGGNKFDISTHPYLLGGDFIPPSVNETYTIATGTSLNRYGGGERIASTLNNRTLEFSVNVFGTTLYQVRERALALQSFLSGYTSDTTYFEFTDGDLPEPLWGQLGAPKRYEIVTCRVSLGEGYTDRSLRASGIQVFVGLEIKPLALGTLQRLAQATGGVFEDNYGSADGTAFGLRIAGPNTNKMTNPVFGHATFGNGWTAGANIVAVKNTDLTFCLPGLFSSARLTAKAATTNTYTQSINAGNTNNHTFLAYVMREDGAAVTSADCQIYYNAAKASTYTSLGNGLYRIEWTGAGINAATETGVLVASGRTIYMLGYQMAEQDVVTPLCYGDLLGCAWTSTAHASTSTRTGTTVKIPVGTTTFKLGSGAIAITIQPDLISTYGSDQYLFSMGATSFYAYYESADDKFYFTDGTNTISTAAQTFAARDILRLLFVWGPSGLAIYKNGASAASGATYTPPANPTSIWIGSSDTPGSRFGSVFYGFTIYDQEPTATQIAAIDSASNTMSAAGRRVDWIPWFYTQDGDDVLDNADDTTYKNWGVIGGVAGTVPADSYMKLTPPGSVVSNVWVFMHPTPYFINPSVFAWTIALSATAADTASEGALYASAPNGDIAGSWYESTNVKLKPDSYITLIRAFSGSAVMRVASFQYTGSQQDFATTTASMGLYFLGETAATPNSNNITSMFSDYVDGGGIGITYQTRADTGIVDINIDYTKSYPRPAIHISNVTDTSRYLVNGGDIYSVASDYVTPGAMQGDAIEFEPNRYNSLITLMGYKDRCAIDDTLTVYPSIVPRWSLL